MQWHLIIMIKPIPELGKWTHLRGLWRRSTASVQPNSWRFTRSAWIRRQNCWRESTILILSVRYNNRHLLEDATFAVSVEHLVCILQTPESSFFLTLNLVFLPLRFSCFHHGQRWLQVPGYGVRRREVAKWPYREEERGRLWGVSCCWHRKGGAARSAWTSGTHHEFWLIHWRRKAAVEEPSALCLLLQYLHNEKRLLHGDMKSCNVVIKGDFESIKICDVGVSLQLDENMKGDDSGVQMVSLKEILEILAL